MHPTAFFGGANIPSMSFGDRIGRIRHQSMRQHHMSIFFVGIKQAKKGEEERKK
jgi:hypothetical protein